MTTNDANRNLRTTAGESSLFAAVLIASAVNLRPLITSVTSALNEVGTAYGLSALAASVLVSLPVLAFAVGVPVGPWLGGRVGPERAIVRLMALLSVALLVRPLSTGLLFLGTTTAATAVAAITVLASSVFRQSNDKTAASHTSFFTGLITTGAAIGALAMVPLLSALAGDVPASLAIWAIPAIGATLALAATSHRPNTKPVEAREWSGSISYLKVAATWSLIGFFGLQTAVYHGVTAWLPSLLRDRGLPAQDASITYFVMSMGGVIGALVAPRVALAGRRRRWLVFLVALTAIVGWAGLAYGSTGSSLSFALLLGVSQGAGFSLSLTFIVFRVRLPSHAASLSATVQGVGCAIGAVGPMLMGILLSLGGSWTLPFLVLVAASALQCAAGLAAAGDHPLERRNPQLPLPGAGEAGTGD